MNKIKKSLLFIGLGTINLLHAGLHIIQFIQSILKNSKQKNKKAINVTRST
jgi:hypothetical protein